MKIYKIESGQAVADNVIKMNSFGLCVCVCLYINYSTNIFRNN